GTLRGMFRNIANNVAGSTKLVPFLSYVCGAFFAASGLLKLKDWINEGDKAGLNPALFRLALSALLIVLPHTMRIFAGTWFGRADGGANVNTSIPAPQLGAFQKAGR